MDTTLEIMKMMYSSDVDYEYVKKSFIPYTVRIWNDLSPTIRNLQTISQFRLKIKGEQFRPPVYYGEGSRKYNIQGYGINVVL